MFDAIDRGAIAPLITVFWRALLVVFQTPSVILIARIGVSLEDGVPFQLDDF